MSSYIRIAVSAVLLSIIAWRTDWSIVGDKFANMDVWLWVAAVVVLTVTMVFSARRWQVFAQELRFERTLGQYCAYYFVGMWFNLSLPTSVGGDVVRVWYLDGKSGRKLAALASIFLERLNGLLVLIAVACAGVLLSPIELPWLIQASVWGIAGAAVVALAALPIIQRWSFLPEERREQMQTVIRLMCVPHVVTWATLMSILVQGAGVVSVWLIGMALGLEVPFAYYCILGPMVSLLTLLPISVNGMGVREVGTVMFLAPLSVHEDSAKALAFLWFAANVAVSLAGGLVYLFGAFPKADEEATTSEESDNGPVDRDSDQGREGQYQKAA